MKYIKNRLKQHQVDGHWVHWLGA